MNLFEKILIIVLLICIFTFLFKNACGNLSLRKLNIISLSYYYLLFFAVIGGCIIFLGFKQHYLIYYMKDATINTAFWILFITSLELPLFITFFNKLQKINNFNEFYNDYIDREYVIDAHTENNLFYYTRILTIVCTLSLAYTFYCIGYVPIIELMKGKFYLLSDRIIISRKFTGNIYIRNILALGLTPIISYLSYIYYKLTHENRWKWLFIYLLILSIMAKTYDFSKAPVILYLIYFYFIEVLLGNANLNVKLGRYLILAFAVVIVMYYGLLGYTGRLLNLSSGPLSRLVITYISGYFLSIQTFPSMHPFLKGASFPTAFAQLFGINEGGIRSGRILMMTYLSKSVRNGTGDVMNSLYVGEAYANFGIAGAIISPIVIAFCLSVIPNIILRLRKTPLNVTLYVLFTFTYVNGLMGGFVDFIYNVQLVAVMIIITFGTFIAQKGRVYFVKDKRYSGV